MSKTLKRIAVAMPTVAEDRRINAAARTDPDALPLTPEQLQAMVPMKALRGRTKSAEKSSWFRFVTAQRLWRISKPLAKAGKAAWTVCCANTFKRMRCLKASDFNGVRK